MKQIHAENIRYATHELLQRRINLVLRDVEENRLTEEKLKESVLYMQSVKEMSHDLIIFLEGEENE